jgi:hypothetical protein
MPSFFERRRKCEAVGVGASCDMTIDVDHQDLHGSKRTAFLRWGSVQGFIICDGQILRAAPRHLPIVVVAGSSQ